jgi:ribonuclease E
MVKKMLINASQPEECRVAVVTDGLLEELDVQIKTREATLGNIYKGVITRVEPSLQAVFVNYGTPKNGFLSINDVHPSYFPDSFVESRRRPRIQDVFKKDGHVIVQVAKEERDHKGASLTTNISLAGRYLVLMPGTDLCGVSRKIEDEIERQKLKEILKQLNTPENMGFIIRTAGMGKTKTELARDLGYLLKLWQSIEKNVGEQTPPALLYREHDVVVRSIIEHFSPDISEILVDENEAHKKARDFFHQVMPKYENLVKLSQEKRPLFNKYQLEEQIEQVYRKRINLKSGGYIIIEPTEALVTVDVNSGSATKEKGVEETAFRVNMEAAPEIARQLRLRDLGGIIVIDFIDMVQKKHKTDVERALKTAFKGDRAKSKISRISTLGLLELSRQRLKSSLGTGEYLECPVCDGRGKIRSPEMSAIAIYRKIKSMLVKGRVSEVRATVPARMAEYLLNNMRSQLVELENLYGCRVQVLMRHGLPDKEVTVEAVREEISEQTQLEALVAAPSVEAEPVLKPAPLSEEEVVAEVEAEKPRKAGRRRRRTRKKPVPPQESEILLSEQEDVQPDTDEIQPVPDSLQPAAEDFEVEREVFHLTAVESDEPCGEPIEEAEPPLGFQGELLEIVSRSLPVSEEVLPVQEVAEKPQPDVTEQKELSSDEEPPEVLAAETKPGEQELRSEPSDQPGEEPQPEEEKTDKAKERRPRKRLLQDFLPFS